MISDLIVTIYKRPEALEMVFESILRQTGALGQVIVTEDGEALENKAVIDKFRARMRCPLLHLSQQDLGNRKPLAQNRAIRASEADYLIFIDGDCILRKDFVESHLALADDKSFLTGRRVELSEKITRAITPEWVCQGYFDRYPITLVMDALVGKTNSFSRMIKTPSFLRGLLGRDRVYDIRGCNFSVHRKHLLAINGFTNDFSGAYGEDSDVEYRLKFLGLQMKSVKNAAIQFHLWHPEQVKDHENQKRLKEVLASQQSRTENGLEEVSRYP